MFPRKKVVPVWKRNMCIVPGAALVPIGCFNIRYLNETDLKLKSSKISFVHNIDYNCQIILQFCNQTVTLPCSV